MKKNLEQILKEIRPDIDFSQQEDLIENGILDSFDIITLVGELEENFEIQIGVERILPENFNSLTAITNLINMLKE